MEKNLKELADQAKEKHLSIEKPSTSDQPVIHGLDDFDMDEIDLSSAQPNETSSVDEGITEDELRNIMPDLDNESFILQSTSLKEELNEYKKNLIINNGLTPEEAIKAVNNRARSKGKSINDKYLEDNPTLGVVTVNKTDSDKLEFTEEEKEKLVKVKSIKLVEVEDEALKTIKVEKIQKKQKVSYLKMVEGSLSKYNVPLLVQGDFVSFAGAQTIQLASVVQHDDESTVETISKQASFVYGRLHGGAIYNKYDDKDSVVMSYKDFANSFYYDDLTMAMFAIVVASSREKSKQKFKCGACATEFEWEYSVRTLMSADGMSDESKERMDTILKNKFNTHKLQEMHDAYAKASRFKSPFTSNIYELSYSTIAKAINLYSIVDDEDVTKLYNSALALYMNNMYIYKQDTDSYISIDDSEDELDLMLDTLGTIPQVDLNLLVKKVNELIVEPKFVLKTQCSECGHKMSNEFSIDKLIFLQAPDSLMEIEL